MASLALEASALVSSTTLPFLPFGLAIDNMYQQFSLPHGVASLI